MPTFALNNPNTINSYGFRVRTDGIDLTRFLTNPVMLNSHDNSPQSLLGRWKNVVKNASGLLLADTDFDTARDSVKEIAGQVDRGFLKGVSMGISFAAGNMIKAADGVLELVKCVLMEASICAVPSNADALKLFDTSGKPMPDSAIKLTLSGLGHQSYHGQGFNPIFTTKEEFYRATEQQQTLFCNNNYADFLRLFSPSHQPVIESYQQPARSTSKTIRTPGTSYNLSSTVTEHSIRSFDDFMNASFDVQMSFKNNNPTAYTALFNDRKRTRSAINTVRASGISYNLNSTVTEHSIRSFDDFMNASFDVQMSFKNNNPSGYAALFGSNRAVANRIASPVPPIQQRQVQFTTDDNTGIISKNDFFQATPEEQLAFKTNNPAAYAALWAKRK